MTNTQIGSSVVVSGTPDIDQRFQDARQIAADILQGETSDYLFFYNGSGQIDVSTYWQQYVLLVGDFTSYTNFGTYSMENVQVYQIYSIRENFQSLIYHNLNGTELDLDSSPVSSFSVYGSSRYADYRYSSQYFTYHKDTVSVTAGSGLVVYSSLENHPKLIEGVQNYAFAGFCLAAVVIGFSLLDRIFRRVY